MTKPNYELLFTLSWVLCNFALRFSSPFFKIPKQRLAMKTTEAYGHI